MQTVLEVIAPLILGSLWAWTVRALKKQHNDTNALKDGVRTMLKSRLVDLHVQYVQTGTGCPQAVKEEAEAVFRSYHGLGGNGVGTHLYNEIIDAKVKPENRRVHD